MAANLVRSNTAKRVSELLESRDGRRHLEIHGWCKGMPIVIAEPAEPLTDVMGLASVHNRPVLLAMVDPSTSELCLVHISLPNAALEVVAACPPEFTAQCLVKLVGEAGMAPFRVKFWSCTAVAHRLPGHLPAAPEVQVASQHA